MSASVISKPTMDRVISALLRSGPAVDVRTEVMPEETDPGAIGRILYKMNLDAVMQRYPDVEGPHDAPGPIDVSGMHDLYIFDPRASDDPVDNLKALSCYVYQCSEGDVMERDLYRKLCAFRSEMAANITYESKAYREASWDS